MKRARDDDDHEKPKSAKAAVHGGSADEYKAKLIATLRDPAWKKALEPEFEKPYFIKICETLFAEEKHGHQIFPPHDEIFNALNCTPLNQVKVVIVGQDPYHDDGQAHGLCFSVQKGITPPPSLKNIYKELQTDIAGFKAPKHGNLEAWARRGVLLLNASLTVLAHKANSHKSIGWQTFTQAVIDHVNKDCHNVVFINWGLFAQKKCNTVDPKKHHILNANHPSPLSASKGFFGCKVFSKTNEYLKSVGQKPIDWALPENI